MPERGEARGNSGGGPQRRVQWLEEHRTSRGVRCDSRVVWEKSGVSGENSIVNRFGKMSVV
ncbi:hypothetical protein MTR_0021s0190 [Medicago truncatula]|uniref:Uncharacterized protein n=1 Tax=Medicago truncatula TaxID=3880 RepID=A0A072TIJ1_MEDTR|nr:hypothetical protein MTR_0021s0190 [Medicago truncatula]